MSTPIWLGRIQRKKLWPVLGSEEFPELRLLDEPQRQRFAAAISSGLIPTVVEDPRRIAVPDLTAARYLRFVRLCYDGAFVRTLGETTDVELYRAFSDGRHGGLIDVLPDDAAAFSRWYETRAFHGAHPFEIVRDAIMLCVHPVPTASRNYFLRLASRRRDRVEPNLIGMALGLSAAGVPFCLENGRAHAEFALGDDWVAVTADEVLDRGCPRWPAGLGLSSAPQSSVLRSQLTPFPNVLGAVHWFDNVALDYEHLHDATAEAGLEP